MKPTWMRALSVSSRDRRTLLRGATVIGLVLLVAKGVPTWRSWQKETYAAAQELEQDVGRARTLASTLPALRDSLRTRSERLHAVTSTLVEGDTPGSAAATLARLVSDAAADAGVTLAGVEPRAETAEAALGVGGGAARTSTFFRVSVHGEMTGDIVSIMQFLADVEHGPATLAVRDLSIAQPEPAAPSNRMEILHGDLTVLGLARRTRIPATREQSSRVTAGEVVPESINTVARTSTVRSKSVRGTPGVGP